MDFVGLVSGGKDSCYNMMCAVNAGHRVVALANLHPGGRGELDSYMYQSVGSEGVHIIAEAMNLPLYRREITGKPINQDFDYNAFAAKSVTPNQALLLSQFSCTEKQVRRITVGLRCELPQGFQAIGGYILPRNKTKQAKNSYNTTTVGDEVEDLYELLKTVKEHHPSIQGVSAGAILSSYQKLRLENVCQRLNLTPLCFLWERDQEELLREMIASGLKAVLVKVAAVGLDQTHLGKSLSEMEPILMRLHAKYGVHPCGEGGEYETYVLDCPLFNKAIVIDDSEIVTHQDDPVAPVHYLQLLKLRLVDK